MEAQTFHFNHPVGSFKESVRAYRKYKKEWRAKMEEKLAKMEEEIMQAKADPFYKVDAVWTRLIQNAFSLVFDEGIENFIAIIVPRQHPLLDTIIARFDSEIAMFQENKPS